MKILSYATILCSRSPYHIVILMMPYGCAHIVLPLFCHCFYRVGEASGNKHTNCINLSPARRRPYQTIIINGCVGATASMTILSYATILSSRSPRPHRIAIVLPLYCHCFYHVGEASGNKHTNRTNLSPARHRPYTTITTPPPQDNHHAQHQHHQHPAHPHQQPAHLALLALLPPVCPAPLC